MSLHVLRAAAGTLHRTQDSLQWTEPCPRRATALPIEVAGDSPGITVMIAMIVVVAVEEVADIIGTVGTVADTSHTHVEIIGTIAVLAIASKELPRHLSILRLP